MIKLVLTCPCLPYLPNTLALRGSHQNLISYSLQTIACVGSTHGMRLFVCSFNLVPFFNANSWIGQSDWSIQIFNDMYHAVIGYHPDEHAKLLLARECSPWQALQTWAHLHSVPSWQELCQNKLQPSLPVLVNHFSYSQMQGCWLASERWQGLLFFVLWFSCQEMPSRQQASRGLLCTVSCQRCRSVQMCFLFAVWITSR